MTVRPSIDQTARAVTLLSWLRIGLGAVALVAPSLPARPWVGDDARRSSVTTVARALGARDVALGVGALAARRHGAPVRGWLEAAALSDGGDVLTTLVGWRARAPVSDVSPC